MADVHRFLRALDVPKVLYGLMRSPFVRDSKTNETDFEVDVDTYGHQKTNPMIRCKNNGK